MLTSLAIRNFRCFEQLDIPRLARVNLIGGKNNIGKTALLEAVWTHRARSLLHYLGPFRTNPRWQVDVDGLLRMAQDLWGWLFYRRQIERTIELVSQSLDQVERTLTLRLESSTGQPDRGPEGHDLSLKDWLDGAAPTLMFQYRSSRGTHLDRRLSVTPSGLAIDGSFQFVKKARFLSAEALDAGFAVESFSRLDGAGRQDEILEIMRIVEPRLRRLSILVSEGQIRLQGDIGIGQAVPLSLMGTGMNRLFSLVCEILDNAGGVVCVDEIENGVHHLALVPLWQGLAEAARRSDVQLFATTHSYECLVAATTAFKETGQQEDLSYLRLERDQAGGIRVVEAQRDDLASAIEHQFEVR
jgi:hypothetical protein